MFKLFALVVGVAAVNEAKLSSDVIKTMSIEFVDFLDVCLDELGINDPDPIIHDIKNFWREDFILLNYLSGCTFNCLARKNQLIDEDGYLQHQKIKEFAMKQGAEAETARQITAIVFSCLDTTNNDACNRSLVAIECVKQRLQELDWEPPLNVIFDDLLAYERRKK